MEGGIAGVEGIDVFGAGVDDVDPGRGVVRYGAGGHGGDSSYRSAYFHHRGHRVL